jgi:bacterioferritin-associated ferredoxin
VLVCHCFAVNERAVRAAVVEGARTVDDVVARCGAGGRCGGCRPLVADLLDEVGVGLPVRASSAA